jgi:hypothetical protein
MPISFSSKPGIKPDTRLSTALATARAGFAVRRLVALPCMAATGLPLLHLLPTAPMRAGQPACPHNCRPPLE